MTLDEVYDAVLSNEEQSPKFIVEIFESNKSLIENTDVNDSTETYKIVMILTFRYSHSLVQRESYTKSIPFLNKAIDLWENKPHGIGVTSSALAWYETLRFDRGQAYHSTKNFPSAISDFEWLHQHYPENERYVIWLIAAKNYKLRRVENLFYCLAAVPITALWLFNITDSMLRHTFEIITPIFLLIGIGLSLIGVLRKKRMKKMKLRR